MIVRANGQPHKIYTRDPGAGYLGAAASAACRLPAGHPEGFFEAFANIYAAAFDAIIAKASGEKVEPINTVFPNVHDGVEGMMFIQQAVASSKQDGAWLPFKCERARR